MPPHPRRTPAAPRPDPRGARLEAVFAIIGVDLLIGYAAILAMAWMQGGWLIDPQGHPARRDFAEFWAAGRLAFGGHAADAYAWASLRHLLETAFHAPGLFANDSFPFLYPPVLLLALAPLSQLPFAAAAVVWCALGYAIYCLVLTKISGRPGLAVLAAAAPAALCCIGCGQNGLLSAALFGGGLYLLDRRPLAAGLVLGAMVFKPQLGLLIPVALVASGRWRSAAAAAAAASALAAASAAVFGSSAWTAFATAFAHGGGGALAGAGIAKLQSVYALAVVLGAPGALAWGLQVCAAAGSAVFVAWLWRSPCGLGLQAAGLLVCALLASPYSFIYDATLAVPALAWLALDAGRRPMPTIGWAILTVTFCAPLIFMAWAVPLTPVCGAAVCALLAIRARRAATATASRGLATA